MRALKLSTLVVPFALAIASSVQAQGPAQPAGDKPGEKPAATAPPAEPKPSEGAAAPEQPALPPAAVAPTAAAPAPSVAPASPAGPYGMWQSPQPTAAPAQPVEAEAPSGPTRDMSRDFWQVEVGARSMWIKAGGYDPFSTNNNLTQVSVSGTRALLLLGHVSIAAGLMYEGGGKEATARGGATMLTVHRMGAVGEGRFHFGRDLYGFAKLTPQAIYTLATLTDASVAADLKQKAWRFGADGTLGVAWNAPRMLGAPSSTPEGWLIGEFGYGWSMSKEVEMSPDVGDSDPSSKIVVNTGPLAFNGVMMRISAAMTF